jgi:hypothetical protein
MNLIGHIFSYCAAAGYVLAWLLLQSMAQVFYSHKDCSPS